MKDTFIINVNNEIWLTRFLLYHTTKARYSDEYSRQCGVLYDAYHVGIIYV